MLLPILPLFVDDIGGTQQQVGFVMGAFAIGLVASRRWLGRWTDQRGRKVVLLIGISVVAIAPLGYLLMHLVLGQLLPYIPTLIAIRAFHGISIAAFTTAYSALVVDFSPVDKRGEVIGYMTLVNPIGVAIGPATGGFLEEWAGYTPVFLASTGLGLLGVFFSSRLRQCPLPQTDSSQTTTPESEQFWALLLSPRVRIPTLVMLLAGITFGVLSTFVPLYIKSTGVNLNPGLFYTAAAVASFSIRLLVGSASDRLGRGLFISISLMFYAASMLMLWQANSPATFLLAGLLEGAGGGTLIPMMAALMADRAHAHERGRLFSLCIGGFDLGIAAAGPLLGGLAGNIGYRYLFAGITVMPLLALVVFFAFSSKTIPLSIRYALGQSHDLYAVKIQHQDVSSR
jgi:MFS family permease